MKNSLCRFQLRLAAHCTAQVQFSRRSVCKLPPYARSATCRKIAAFVKGTARFARGSKTCASAPTVSTIARIAGKPATSPLPAAVATEPQSFHLQTDPDARLAAAVGGAARFLADAAGLESDAISQLQSSIVAACREAFERLTGAHPQLDVTLTRFTDRIEVALCHAGEDSPALGLDTIAGFAAQTGGQQGNTRVFAGIDRVQYETRGGESVTRLTKYIGEVTPRI